MFGSTLTAKHMQISRLFSEHPESVGETYFEHMVQAFTFAIKLGLACLVCFVHALLPCLFKKTGSRLIETLHARMVVNRDSRNCGHAQQPKSEPSAPSTSYNT